jgi:hypothetical protein
MAQATATQGSKQEAQSHETVKNAAESNPACQRIVAECKKLGFVEGEYKIDNGVWKDCFYPVVNHGKPTREGKSIEVPVSASDVQTCRAVVDHAKQGAKKTTQPKQ